MEGKGNKKDKKVLERKKIHRRQKFELLNMGGKE